MNEYIELCLLYYSFLGANWPKREDENTLPSSAKVMFPWYVKLRDEFILSYCCSFENFLSVFKQIKIKDRNIAQGVGPWLLINKAQVQFQGNLCRFCNG
jgi:hypothetical protein